jgi:hypothetical protein
MSLIENEGQLDTQKDDWMSTMIWVILMKY